MHIAGHTVDTIISRTGAATSREYLHVRASADPQPIISSRSQASFLKSSTATDYGYINKQKLPHLIRRR
jgi:hypothetical protein